MQELTLTGGTLLDPLASTSTSVINDSLHSHSHSHSYAQQQHQHQHQQNQTNKPCCGLHGAVQPVVQLQKPPQELVATQTEAETVHTLQTLCRMGTHETLLELWNAWVDHKGGNADQVLEILGHHQPDAAGHTLLHWMAKRTDNVRFVQFGCQQLRQNPLTATTDGTGMTALHWACTEAGAIPVVSYLLQQRAALLETRDTSGCTPLLIAAQYGHVETAAYLLQKKANLAAVDDAGDSATHWAAYKGSTTVLGLLSYYDTHHLTTADRYGQTPLHLAALRGHVTAVRYILQQCSVTEQRRLIALKDKNDRTPEELAVHKEKRGAATFLRDYRLQKFAPHAANTWTVQRLEALVATAIRNVCSVHAWKVWLGLPVEDSADESPRFPYYYIVANFVAHALWMLTIQIPVFRTASGLLWDCMLLHAWSFLTMLACSYAFYQTVATDPGSLDAAHCPNIAYWQALYEETLLALADDDPAKDAIRSRPLCHTCHIARPLRSKHDRFTKKCVLLFDHHCPFVGNTVGLYNYKWFYLVLLTMTLYFIGFWISLALFVSRSAATPWFILVVGVYLGLHMLMSGGMLIYHTQLIMVNLTTNEHVNVGKYEYFWETRTNSDTGSTIASSNGNGNAAAVPRRRYRNPWMRGSHWRNILDRFNPSDRSYMLPEEHASLLKNEQPINGNAHLEMV
jgi:hypothetical protein